MKMVWIEPVPVKQGTWSEQKFTQAEHVAAVKEGPKYVPYVTARENMRASNGLYRIRPEKSDAVAAGGGGPIGLPSIESMDRAQLFQACMVLNIRMAKSNLPTPKLRQIVKQKWQKFMEVDDTAPETDDEEADVPDEDTPEEGE
jgi:hypothetical protein